MKRLTSLDNITTPESWKKKVLDTASLGAPKLKKKYEFATVALAASLAIAFIGINVFSHRGEIDIDEPGAQVEETYSAAEKDSKKADQFKDPTEPKPRADTYDELLQKVIAHSQGTGTINTYSSVDSGVIVKITSSEDYKIVYLMTKVYSYTSTSSSAIKEVNVVRKFRINSETLCYPWKGEKDPSDYKKVELHPEDETPYDVTLGNVDEFQFNVGDLVQIYSNRTPGYDCYGEMTVVTALKCYGMSESSANATEVVSKDTKDALKAAAAIARTGKITDFETAVWNYASNIDVKCPELVLSDETSKDMRVKKLTTIPMGRGEAMYTVLWVRPDRDDDMSNVYTYNEVYAKDDHIASVDIMVKDKKICTVNASADTYMQDPDDPEACEHENNVIDYMYATPDPEDDSAFYVIVVTCSGDVEYRDNIDYTLVTRSDIEYMMENMYDYDSKPDIDEFHLPMLYNVIDTDPTLNDPNNVVVASFSDWIKAKDDGLNTYKDTNLIIAEPEEFKEYLDSKGIKYDTDFNNEEYYSVQIHADEMERLYNMKDKNEVGYGSVTEKLYVDISFDD